MIFNQVCGQTKKYLCIHCKEQFDKLPPVKANECRAGYRHDLIKNEKRPQEEVQFSDANRCTRCDKIKLRCGCRCKKKQEESK